MPTKKTAGTNNKKTADSTTEQFKVTGSEILEKIKKLIKEGNVRRIIIKDDKGRQLMEIPVTIAVIGTVLAPVLAAVGALAALLSKATLEVERRSNHKTSRSTR